MDSEVGRRVGGEAERVAKGKSVRLERRGVVGTQNEAENSFKTEGSTG
jgi:hypothetical protein